ncbi:glycosyltransferase [Pokkaliibacter sp. CJK22405]|uniref:glycosyltransferase n=1 Tax=Pokkaliibacter sp. CJK22405 TaxID=3384615 RepID=UPI003985504F
MKVIQFLPGLEGGGVEKGTLEVARFLVEQGHTSVVVSGGGRLVRQLEAEGSQHVEWNLGSKSLLTLRHILPLRRWIRQQNADILHVRSRMPAWMVWLAWRGIPKKERPHLISTVHGLHSVNRYSAIMCCGERVIAVSDTVKQYIATQYPKTDMSKVRVVYRGIEPEEFPRSYEPTAEWLTTWQEHYPQLMGKQVLTLAGRLTRLKGHHDFISLVATLVNAGRPVHGLIVGGEDPKRQAYAQELYQRIKDEGLAAHITFTGARSDIRDIYRQSTLVYSLSTSPESFGRTVAEALAMGVPVVGYDHGGVGDILAKVFPAGKVPLKDSDELQATTARLLDAPELPGEMPFLRQNMLEQTLAVYREVLA